MPETEPRNTEARVVDESASDSLALQLGPLRLETPVISAPVAGFTDLLFRAVLREFGGCGLIYTEMVSAGGWIQGRIPPDRLNGVEGEPRPLGVQLWDREPEMIREAAARLADLDISIIDLNFGCPKKRIMGKQGAGAKLLRDPATIGAMVAAAVEGSGGIPVTAKIRLGPSADEITAIDVVRAAADNGAVAVTVHGRTAAQNYSQPCDVEAIGEVVAASPIPVIANGDIADAATARDTLERSGAAAVMVARTALSHPWVFREITAGLRREPIPPPPTIGEQIDQLRRHHASMVEQHGDPWGTVQMRKFACRYLTGVPGATDFRRAVSGARDSEHFREILDHFFGAGGPLEEWVDRTVVPANDDTPEEEACSVESNERARGAGAGRA